MLIFLIFALRNDILILQENQKILTTSFVKITLVFRENSNKKDPKFLKFKVF